MIKQLLIELKQQPIRLKIHWLKRATMAESFVVMSGSESNSPMLLTLATYMIIAVS